MIAPEYALQKAIFAALKSDPEMVAAFDTGKPNIVDFTDKNTEYPFVQIGRDQEIPKLADCIDASEFFLTIDVWSVKPGFKECKAIAGAVRGTLHDAQLDLEGHRLISLRRRGVRYLDGTDGLAAHAVLTFHALTEPKL